MPAPTAARSDQGCESDSSPILASAQPPRSLLFVPTSQYPIWPRHPASLASRLGMAHHGRRCEGRGGTTGRGRSRGLRVVQGHGSRAFHNHRRHHASPPVLGTASTSTLAIVAGRTVIGQSPRAPNDSTASMALPWPLRRFLTAAHVFRWCAHRARLIASLPQPSAAPLSNRTPTAGAPALAQPRAIARDPRASVGVGDAVVNRGGQRGRH
jgi:hypothetical protein